MQFHPFVRLFLSLSCLSACQAATTEPQAKKGVQVADSASEHLTLEQVIAGGELSYRNPGSLPWIGGREYAHSDADGLAAVHAVTGARRMIANRAALIPEGRTEALEVDAWTLSADQRRVLIYTNSKRVWRLNTRGDYWALDLDGGVARQIGSDFPESSLQFAKFSPDGTRVAYVQGHDIWVESLDGGARTRLTEGGSETLIHGTFDWVYEEEFFLYDGFRWSPDGERIAFWQLDASGIGSFPLVDMLGKPYPTLKWLSYPKAGTQNSAARIGVIAASGGSITWLKTPGDPRNTYPARMEWLNSESLILQHLDRAQQVNSVLIGDVQDGGVKVLFVDRDEAWIDINAEFAWLDEEHKSCLWLSERDGWRRPYVLSCETGELRPLHQAEHDLVSIELIDTAGGWLYYLASPEDPTQRFLYRVSLQGGDPERLTPADAPGWNSYGIAAGADLALVTSSSFTSAPKTTLIQLPSHEPIRVLEENVTASAARGKLKLGARERFQVTTRSGTELHGYAFYPPDFDPKQSWPVLFHVYGEPWGQTVQDRADLGNEMWHLMLTQRGYVVMSLDGRGTPGPRGRDWRKCVYGEVGVLASQDQAEGALALLQKHDWMDPERLGLWGWSGGGSQTLNTLFRYPKVFSTGIAVASVPDQVLYDTIYQERYMGTPMANPEGYRKASPIHFAEGLEAELLIVHGTGDDNVHDQGAWQLIDKLIALSKPFEMMFYPSRSHGIFEGEGTRLHLFETMTRFLQRTLPPGAR